MRRRKSDIKRPELLIFPPCSAPSLSPFAVWFAVFAASYQLSGETAANCFCFLAASEDGKPFNVSMGAFCRLAVKVVEFGAFRWSAGSRPGGRSSRDGGRPS